MRNILLNLGLFVLFLVLMTVIYLVFFSGSFKEEEIIQEQAEEQESGIAGLQIEDIELGQGDEVVSGDRISVNYRGFLLDGTEFDNSYDRGVPFAGY